MADWYVYIARCADGTLYTGITTDVSRRLDEHNRGHGAKYTAVRRPLTLVYVAPAADRSAASRLERRIKLLPREEKLSLIAGTREVP
jgi:putative endonuclease